MSAEQIKVLRPADCYLAGHELPTRESMPETPKPVVTAEFIHQYNVMPASEVRRRYESDRTFAALVDEMLKGESSEI